MEQVTIYQFEVYDPQSDLLRKSRRWGTRAAIEQTAHGKVLHDTATLVDESVVASDIAGFTEKEFDPHRQPISFQKVVQ